MGRIYLIMRGLRFLVKCELDRGGPSEEGEEILSLLDEAIAAEEVEHELAQHVFTRPEQKPPIMEGREKESDDDAEATEG